jgi:hypothetical protein
VSPFEIATGQEVLRFLATLPKALIILPGNYRNTPSPHQIQRVIRRGSVVFAEGPRRPFLITRRRTLLLPPQIFAKAPTAQEMKRLVRAVPQRTISIGNRNVTFLLCGELIAFNPDGSTKHARNLRYDIIINPAHTTMGHWNHLGKKLACLSRRSIAVYVTNNDHNRHITSDVRIYKNGKLMKRHSGINVAWSECAI